MDKINKVELLTFEELISSPQALLYLLLLLTILVMVIRWFINEINGNNYYRKYPVAKAMDDMAKNGELKSFSPEDIDSATASIDYTSPKEDQALQFKEYFKSNKSSKKNKEQPIN